MVLNRRIESRMHSYADAQMLSQNALRVLVKTKGCAGNYCELEYATTKQKMDEEVVAHGMSKEAVHVYRYQWFDWDLWDCRSQGLH